MRPEEARIVAHVCGDGWMTTWIERNALQIVNGRRYRRDRKKYEVGYCNTDLLLLDQFAKDVLNVFNRKPLIITRKNEIRVRSKRIFDRVAYLGGGNTYNWKLGNEIRRSNKKVKKF